MPPIENELAEDDFNTAVVTHLYLAESRQKWARTKALALMLHTGRVPGEGTEPTEYV